MSEETIFERGLKVNINDHVEKKGQFSYLSWAFAVRELRKLDPKAMWMIIHFDYAIKDGDVNGLVKIPYMDTNNGCFVEVVVTLSDGTAFPQIHPVLDHCNKPIHKPNAFQINTSLQRCLTKAIALASGIGLNLYAGEDLPPNEGEVKKVTDTFPGSKVVDVDVMEKELLAADTLDKLKTVWKNQHKERRELEDVGETEKVSYITAVKDQQKIDIEKGG